MTDDLVKRLREFERWDPDQKEAADRIEKLEAILRRAVDGYDKAYCRDEVDFDWVDDAKAALEKTK